MGSNPVLSSKGWLFFVLETDAEEVFEMELAVPKVWETGYCPKSSLTSWEKSNEKREPSKLGRNN